MQELREQIHRTETAEEELSMVKAKNEVCIIRHHRRLTINTLAPQLQVLEEDNQNLSSQIAVIEDQLKMASVASSRKIEDVQQRHRELGLKLKELLKLHDNLESHLAA